MFVGIVVLIIVGIVEGLLLVGLVINLTRRGPVGVCSGLRIKQGSNCAVVHPSAAISAPSKVAIVRISTPL